LPETSTCENQRVTLAATLSVLAQVSDMAPRPFPPETGFPPGPDGSAILEEVDPGQRQP
jgi:hypothetical protein